MGSCTTSVQADCRFGLREKRELFFCSQFVSPRSFSFKLLQNPKQSYGNSKHEFSSVLGSCIVVVVMFLFPTVSCAGSAICESRKKCREIHRHPGASCNTMAMGVHHQFHHQQRKSDGVFGIRLGQQTAAHRSRAGIHQLPNEGFLQFSGKQCGRHLLNRP